MILINFNVIIENNNLIREYPYDITKNNSIFEYDFVLKIKIINN